MRSEYCSPTSWPHWLVGCDSLRLKPFPAVTLSGFQETFPTHPSFVPRGNASPCPCQLKGFETNCFEGRWEQAWFEGPLRVMILVGLAVEGK